MLPYNPDRSKEQAHVNVAQRRVRRLDDHGAVVLGAVAHAHDAKVHDQQRPQSPVQHDAAQVAQRPRRLVVDAPQIVVMDLCVAARQRGGTLWQPSQIFLSRRNRLPRWSWPVREPPEQGDAEQNGDDAVHQEHPLEPDQTAGAVHLLEPGRNQADHGGRDLGSGEVLPDALPHSRRRVEQRQIVCHPGPHAGDHDPEEQTEETDSRTNR